MLQVLYSGATRELELSGTRQGLLRLGQLLRGRAGSCGLSENLHPFPYERSLSKIATPTAVRLRHLALIANRSGHLLMHLRGDSPGTGWPDTWSPNGGKPEAADAGPRGTIVRDESTQTRAGMRAA
ncbi:hypothetical protein RKD23_000035 [Streptomyces sp. SAI-170]